MAAEDEAFLGELAGSFDGFDSLEAELRAALTIHRKKWHGDRARKQRFAVSQVLERAGTLLEKRLLSRAILERDGAGIAACLYTGERLVWASARLRDEEPMPRLLESAAVLDRPLMDAYLEKGGGYLESAWPEVGRHLHNGIVSIARESPAWRERFLGESAGFRTGDRHADVLLAALREAAAADEDRFTRTIQGLVGIQSSLYTRTGKSLWSHIAVHAHALVNLAYDRVFRSSPPPDPPFRSYVWSKELHDFLHRSRRRPTVVPVLQSVDPGLAAEIESLTPVDVSRYVGA